MNSIRRRFVFLLVLSVLAGAGTAIASHTGPATIGDFEIDGNTTDDALAGIDWDTFPEAVTFDDPEGTECTTDDDIFTTGGSKENTPGLWVYGCGSAPSKSDIVSGATGTRDVNGESFLYISFARLGDNGEANLSVEFNQSDDTFDNDNNPTTPEVVFRTAGDLMVFLEVTLGGQVTAPTVFVWTGTHISGAWVDTTGTAVQGTDWDAATNANAQGRWNFAEAALRLSAFGFVKDCPGPGLHWLKTNSTSDITGGVLKDRTVRKSLDLSNCATKNWTFSFDPEPIAGASVFAVYTVPGGENREIELTDADQDGTYTAQDTSIPPGNVTYHFEVRNGASLIWQSAEGNETFAPDETKTNSGSMHYDITLTPESAENFDDDPHTFTAFVFEVGTNTPLPNVPVNFELFGGTPDGCGSLDPTSGLTAAGGTITTTLSSTGPCTTSVRAWINSALGATTGLDDGEASDASTKSFVEYALTVTPGDASNETGQPHTFTITLTKDSGGGPAGVSGAAVDLTLDPGTSDAHFTTVSAGTVVDDTHATCTTDTSGQCTATIEATTAGDVSLTASYLASDSSGNTRTITGEANKAYRTFALSVTPGDATNEVDDPHTFTVTLTQDSGVEPVGLAGETVSLALDPGTSDAHFTAVETGTIVDDTHATCTTNLLGQCTATIVAATPGSVTLTASWSNETIVTGGASTSDTAGKQYLDFRLTASPDDATNEVGDPHTFTITLEQDDGTGFSGLAGETVSLTLDPGTSDAHFTAVETGTVVDDTHATCTTNAGGQCTATIVATTPGSVTLTASWSNETIVAGGASDGDTAGKTYLEFRLGVTPAEAVNLVGDPHTFTITLEQNDGSGFTGLAGETVSLTLDPGATDAHFTAVETGTVVDDTHATCTTNAGGQCTATIVAAMPGSVTLTANWDNQTIVVGGASRDASASKTYVAVSLAKSSCPDDRVTRGGILTYRIDFSTSGATLTNATLIDDLPAEIRFVAADPIAGVTPVTPAVGDSNGTVSWTFSTLPPGEYSATITVEVAPASQTNGPYARLGEKITNSVVLDADEIPEQSASHDVLVTNEGAAADGRAFGISLTALATELIAPTPDSDVASPAELRSVPNPLGPPAPLARLLRVVETNNAKSDSTGYTASATAVDVNAEVPGLVKVEADSVIARSSSFAQVSGAGSSHSGSIVQNLRVNDTQHGDISEPTTIEVKDGAGNIIAEVHVLERIASGAAAEETQPSTADMTFASGLAVNGIHVVVYDLALTPIDESTDLIVSHAETSAAYPSGLACDAAIPAVSGRAAAVETANLTPDATNVVIAEVILPITGGTRSASLADVDLPSVGTSDSAFTSTQGSISGDGSPQASSSAQIKGLDLLGGTITATLVQATSSSTAAGSTGDAVIADLEIAGIPVCVECDPDVDEVLLGIPDTVILLNEQIPEPGGLTVIAIHIFVVGEGNPLGLPVGAEILISSAHSDVHAADAPSRTKLPIEG